MLRPERTKCEGCAGRPNECWTPCKGRGYCSACDGTQGTKGACCMRGDKNDPAECRKAGVQFLYSGYHECVLVLNTGARRTDAENTSH